MHVFLAGSTGVLGRRIIPLLTGHGHQVTALTRRRDQASMLRSLGAHPAVADAFEPESLAKAVKLAAPDVVMHQLTDLTSGTSASNADLRARGTRNLMDAAHGAGVGRVISQSIAWAYAAGCEPATEQIPLDLGAAEPRLTTIRGIAALEQMTQEAPQWVVLRSRQPWARGADNRHARTHLAWSPRFPSWRRGFHAMRPASPASKASR